MLEHFGPANAHIWEHQQGAAHAAGRPADRAPAQGARHSRADQARLVTQARTCLSFAGESPDHSEERPGRESRLSMSPGTAWAHALLVTQASLAQQSPLADCTHASSAACCHCWMSHAHPALSCPLHPTLKPQCRTLGNTEAPVQITMSTAQKPIPYTLAALYLKSCALAWHASG